MPGAVTGRAATVERSGDLLAERADGPVVDERRRDDLPATATGFSP
ncbi:hypothetical protein [Actinomycetospora corticicola]|uniref:Uncharacterized protein n=1 Tax=Actinomycetospora corticicola TaxID=663602 RepID=A0A7Y9J7A2_9PSEU|nr:hypothetical protein [Actinomycetospora corticicola]NYD38140.1 hypothetical protein [Actinomycetospora corticicola]